MNHLNAPRSELQRLLDILVDGTLSAQDRDRLTDILQVDPSARQQYCRFISLHSHLKAEQAPPLAVPSELVKPNVSQQIVPSSPRSPVLGFLSSLSRQVPGGEFTVGSLLLLVIVAAFWGLSQAILYPRIGSHDLAEASAGREGKTVATIREVSEVEWSRDSLSLLALDKGRGAGGEGAAIAQNQPLSIQSGLIELQLISGATLLIEGPADWQINGENFATLTQGKLVARVPQQAIGFTLETPSAKIIDLGTEFGVEVGVSGSAEVYVLNGLVNVQAENDGGVASSPVRLEAGKGLRIALDGTQTAGNQATSEKLTRLAEGGRNRVAVDPGYEVLFHYRLGEDDKNAKPGELAADQTLGAGTLGSTHPLDRVGSPKYSGETANANSKLALTISGGSRGEGYVGTEFTGMPTDNFVLEAWVRTRSAKTQIVAYAGHPSHNGYGLFAVNGTWSRVYGSQVVLNGDIPVQLNEWTQLAFLRQRGASQLFVNGKASGAEVRTEPKTPTPALLIGHDELEETFDGEIDEVRLIRLNRFFQTNMLLWKTTVGGSEGN